MEKSKTSIMRKWLLIITIATFNTLVSSNVKAEEFRKIENKAFNFGERLDYKVGYSFITAGTGYFQVMPMSVNQNGRKKIGRAHV